eukprot:NODE_3683_length_744_cov_39.998561_g129_i36.p1 GENE.NODE_3683_length_744_cov_39.998561_g129_i36~~NODE_3683_length_744_cov_39.998561_g129_i36.p1  ORF type:complete len:162 (-),score=47.67 NODE_3683_length_744_cov_39.998561_g129_i36:258-719(-)
MGESALADGFEKLLQRVKHAMPGTYNVPINFKDLNYVAEVTKGSARLATVWTKILSCLTFCHRTKTVHRPVLTNLTGSFLPGTTTLILGPPKSGKSAFMKVMSGRAVENKKKKKKKKKLCVDTAGFFFFFFFFSSQSATAREFFKGRRTCESP